MESDVIGLILARGGSRGVPRKNLQMIGGLSLVTRAIRTLQAGRVRSPQSRGNREVYPRVYVSTDDEMIAASTIASGANVIDRPADLATSEAQGTDALIHALSMIPGPVSLVLHTQCTSPLLTTADIVRCAHALECGYDMTVTTTPFHGVVLDSQGRHLTYEVGGDENRQQREQMKICTGGCYCFRPEYLTRPWWSGCVGCVNTDHGYLEIDTEEDLKIARMVVPGIESERAERLQARSAVAS